LAPNPLGSIGQIFVMEAQTGINEDPTHPRGHCSLNPRFKMVNEHRYWVVANIQNC
jgi:hypothetical protein